MQDQSTVQKKYFVQPLPFIANRKLWTSTPKIKKHKQLGFGHFWVKKTGCFVTKQRGHFVIYVNLLIFALPMTYLKKKMELNKKIFS